MPTNRIAGIDSGATAAYAIVDLAGDVVKVASRKNGGEEFLLEGLQDYSLVVIAADTNPPSKAALKLKRALHSRLYAPRHSLSVLEKELLCQEHKVRNAHERDALACALKCHNVLSSKLRQLRRRLKSRPSADYDFVACRMLEGVRVSDVIGR